MPDADGGYLSEVVMRESTTLRCFGGMKWRRHAHSAVFTLLAAVSACGGSSPVIGDPVRGGGRGGSGGVDPAPTSAVSVRDRFFDPLRISIPRRDVVVWTWNGQQEHNVTWVEPGLSDSPTQTDGTHEARMPDVAGEFVYYCTIHGTPSSGMRGTVMVQ